MKHFKKSFKFPVTILVAVSCAVLVSPVRALERDGTPGYLANASTSTLLVEVGKLLDAKVDSNVIIAYVQNSRSSSQLNATEVIGLKDRGANAEVLKALLDHQGRPSAPAAPATASASQNSNLSPAPAPAYTDAPAAAAPSYVYSDPGYTYPYAYSYPYDYGYVSPSYYVGLGWPYYYPYSRGRFYGHGFHTFGGSHFGGFPVPFGGHSSGFHSSGGLHVSSGGGFHASGGGFGGHSSGGHSAGGHR